MRLFTRRKLEESQINRKCLHFAPRHLLVLGPTPLLFNAGGWFLRYLLSLGGHHRQGHRGTLPLHSKFVKSVIDVPCLFSSKLPFLFAFLDLPCRSWCLFLTICFQDRFKHWEPLFFEIHWGGGYFLISKDFIILFLISFDGL